MKLNFLWGILLFALVTLTGLCQEETESEYRHRLHKTGWHYRWLAPVEQIPSRGYVWQKAYRGECIYLDDRVVAIKTDHFHDTLYFSYTGRSAFTPSLSALRVGSKIEVRCDTRNRVRSLRTLPLHIWMELQKRG